MPMWKKDNIMTWDQNFKNKRSTEASSSIFSLSVPKDKDGLGIRVGEVAQQKLPSGLHLKQQDSENW